MVLPNITIITEHPESLAVTAVQPGTNSTSQQIKDSDTLSITCIVYIGFLAPLFSSTVTFLLFHIILKGIII